MFPFVQKAMAMAPAGGQNVASDSSVYAMFYNFFPFLMVIFILWLVVFRPQQKKLRDHQEMIQSLAKGDRVRTDSGIHGTITKLDDQVVSLEISSKVVVDIDRVRIASKLEG